LILTNIYAIKLCKTINISSLLIDINCRNKAELYSAFVLTKLVGSNDTLVAETLAT